MEKEIKKNAEIKRGVSLVVRRDNDINARLDFILNSVPVLQNDSDATRHAIIETSNALGYDA